MNSLNKYSEPELVSLLQERHEASFSYLYDNYAGALSGVIRAIIPDPETVNDVLQEVFVNIWRKIGLYDPSKGRLFTWMLNVARNAAIDKVRSKGYHDSLKNSSIPDDADSQAEKAMIVLPVEDAGLKKMLSALKEEHRVLIDLSYFQGYTHEEIAKGLGIPLGTVKTRIRSALMNLRTMIQQ
ncbi:MAG: sigma-70 family RNA polymerase sigma factor [Chitinophagaceae bacterium]